MEEKRIPKKSIVYEFRKTRLRCRLSNRWQDEVREDRRIVGGEERQEKVYNRQEWRKAPENSMESSHSVHASGMNVVYENCVGWGFRVCYLPELKDTAVHNIVRNS
jgi:hypothetical protein